MRPAFDEAFFRHINEASRAERGHASRLLSLVELSISKPYIKLPLAITERVITFLLTLPIPIYAGIVHMILSNLHGLPKFSGVYLRALYYRGPIGNMESNVLIEQGVFLAYPKNVTLREFCFLDKNVIIMAKSAYVGRRVHIAPNVFISGGGSFKADDYSCIATNSQLITSTEVLKDGARVFRRKQAGKLCCEGCISRHRKQNDITHANAVWLGCKLLWRIERHPFRAVLRHRRRSRQSARAAQTATRARSHREHGRQGPWRAFRSIGLEHSLCSNRHNPYLTCIRRAARHGRGSIDGVAGSQRQDRYCRYCKFAPQDIALRLI